MADHYHKAQYQEASEVVGRTAGGAATTEYSKFVSFAALKLEKVNANIVTAGTAAGHGFDVYVGTASVATLDLGTTAAGNNVEVSVPLAAVAAKTPVYVKSKADTVGKAEITFQVKKLFV